MAILRTFNGMEIRVPGNYGGITTEQRVTRDLMRLLYKLGIKSAQAKMVGWSRKGYELKLKIDGKEVAYAKGVSYNVDEPLRDLTDDGSVD